MKQDVDVIMKLEEIKYMKLALKEAKKAYDKDEVPVGAVIVIDNKVVAKAHNLRETKNSAIAHAEILAIEKACKKVGWRLEQASMYVTLEPCSMCSGAIIQARIKNLYYGAEDKKTGAAGSVLNLFNYDFNHKVNVFKGLLATESTALIKGFFKKLRA